MSNILKATEILTRLDEWIDLSPENAVEALADAGLLAPDLPSPAMTPESHPEWAQQHRADWESEPPEVIWETPGKDEWWISFDKEYGLYGGWTEFPEEALEGLSPQDMKNIAGIFLAAANYAEEANQ